MLPLGLELINKGTCMDTVAIKIEYIIMLIKLFARHFGLSYQQAYRYVSQHGGIEYAERHYSVLHTLPFQDRWKGLPCTAIRMEEN